MSVSYNDLQQYYSRVYRPDLTTIVVIGDVTPQEARAVVEKWFGSWTATGPKPDVVLPPVPANKPSAVHVPDPSRVQDQVELAEELEMNRFSPDYYPLQVGDHVLGGGFYATRLYRELREVTGLVYNVDDSLSASQTRARYSSSFWTCRRIMSLLPNCSRPRPCCCGRFRWLNQVKMRWQADSSRGLASACSLMNPNALRNAISK